MKSLNQQFYELCTGTDECLRCKSYQVEVEKLKKQIVKLKAKLKNGKEDLSSKP